MKVISGKYRGRVLKGYDLKETRPTMDRVKESLFAMIQSELKDKKVLDLFAGSGNLGIEALSMSSSFVYLVDFNKKAVKCIDENLKILNIEKEKYKILNKDYRDALLYLKNREEKIDLIFLDPPYNTDYIAKSILLINKYELLSKCGLLICETDNLEKIPFCNKLIELKNKRYGDKYIVIFKNK